MSDIFFADMVQEASVSTGPGTFALAGAVPGARRFADAVPDGARFGYAIAGVTHRGEWEVGEGTIDAEGRLDRNPGASSDNGAVVDFGAGLKTVSLVAGSAWMREIEQRRRAGIAGIDGLADAIAAAAAGPAWQAYGPVIAPSTAGATGFASAITAARVRKQGRLVHVQLHFTLSSLGSMAPGAAHISVTLPHMPLTASTGWGTENALTGRMLQANASGGSNLLTIKYYDATSAWALGAQVRVSIAYESVA